MAQKRAGALGVHSIDHFGLQVPDLAVAKDFYTAFGLDVRETDAGLELYTFGHDQCWARIVEGPVKQLRYISFGVYEEDEAPLHEDIDAGIVRQALLGQRDLETIGPSRLAPPGVPPEQYPHMPVPPDSREALLLRLISR